MLKHSQTPAPGTACTSWALPSPAGTPESGEAKRLVQGRPQNVMEQGSGFASGLEFKAAQMGPIEDRVSEAHKGKWEQLQSNRMPKGSDSMAHNYVYPYAKRIRFHGAQTL